MPSRVLMLRAVNVGQRRIAMPALRDLMTGAGLQDVRTYVQSGNVVLSSDTEPARLAAESRDLISGHFGFDVPVIVRTAQELEAVVALDPLGAVAVEPKRYLVTFCDREVAADRVARLEGLVAGDERFEVHGRELFAWLPDGVARSKLATAMAKPARDVIATARNWTTVLTLLSMARELG